jgi:DNA-binding transcriptional ArsR family regulator
MRKPTCWEQSKTRVNQIEAFSNLLKIISDTNRIKILCVLNSEKICVCDLAEKLDLSQNLVSHHLKVMLMGGILGKERTGNQLFYYILPTMKAKTRKLFELIDPI